MPAPTARRDDYLLAILEDLGENLLGVVVAQKRTRRNRHDDVGAAPSTLVRAHPMLAALRDPLIAVGVVEQRREVGVTAHDDAAAATPVAAVRAAHRRAPFPAERGAARSARAPLYS